VQYEEFLNRVMARAGLKTREEALAAIQAALGTLAERISGGEARDIAARVPPEIKAYLDKGGDEKAHSFPLREFYRRVSKYCGVDAPTGVLYARAVLSTLRSALPPDEFRDVLSQLPVEFAELFHWDPEAPIPLGHLPPETQRESPENKDKEAQPQQRQDRGQNQTRT
jgi:uncharacterized protein (DUF2267 family)